MCYDIETIWIMQSQAVIRTGLTFHKKCVQFSYVVSIFDDIIWWDYVTTFVGKFSVLLTLSSGFTSETKKETCHCRYYLLRKNIYCHAWQFEDANFVEICYKVMHGIISQHILVRLLVPLQTNLCLFPRKPNLRLEESLWLCSS